MSDLEHELLGVDNSPELNITPLVDVMLVLLAILMVSTPVLVFEENINLPKGSKSQAISKKMTLNIMVNKKQEITFKKHIFTFKDFPENFILLTNGINKDSVVYLSADKELTYGSVMLVLKSIKESGFLKVSLVTDG